MEINFGIPVRFVLSARSQYCEKRILVSAWLAVRPSVRGEQLGSHWTDFHEIPDFNIVENLS
jgi:hypothetical protein